ncbi:hypothetical protein [Helicobacter pylori]|uniref:hypothetical protein n=1 Tax=Helicobacter pylori TaxID=210 RepID=UPI000575D14D|nr:hypothetical protein [Helicobacter pylori]ANT42522.1 hypothetical protein [Helicobacter phage Pt22899G]KHL84504.1 hypothetical protein HPY228_07170 [Helicobacter pylori]
MRQEHETATSFNQLKEITQAIMLEKGAPKNATNQESERTQASENANASDLTQETGSKPKARAQAKKGALKPTKRAFSERQKTAFRDSSQARAKASHTTNAFKSEQANNSNFKPGLAKHQEKGGSNEA